MKTPSEFHSYFWVELILYFLELSSCDEHTAIPGATCLSHPNLLLDGSVPHTVFCNDSGGMHASRYLNSQSHTKHELANHHEVTKSISPCSQLDTRALATFPSNILLLTLSFSQAQLQCISKIIIKRFLRHSPRWCVAVVSATHHPESDARCRGVAAARLCPRARCGMRGKCRWRCRGCTERCGLQRGHPG